MIRFNAIFTPEDWRIGCAKSHLELLKLARDRKWGSILIFEDDMECVDENIVFLSQDLISLSKIKWDIFYLWCQFKRGGDLPFLIPKNNLMKMGWGRWTHAIAYNHSCYELLINKLSMIDSNCEKFIRIFGAIDVYIEKILHSKLHVYMVNHVVCEQSIDFSDINKKVEDYHDMIVKNFYNLKSQKKIFHFICMLLRKPIWKTWEIYNYYCIWPLKHFKWLVKKSKKLFYKS